MEFFDDYFDDDVLMLDADELGNRHCQEPDSTSCLLYTSDAADE